MSSGLPSYGDLRSQIELQRVLFVEDDFHQPVHYNSTIQAGVWAKVVVSGSEDVSIAGKRTVRTRYQIWIRWRPTWTATQCVWNGITINFEGTPVDVDGAHKFFMINGVSDG